MKDITEKNFGLIIAFLLPGFIFLWGISFSRSLGLSLASPTKDSEPTIAGFFTISLASLAVGMLISAVRFVVVDCFLFRPLLKRSPKIHFSKLRDKDALELFLAVVENHYRYFQYYSNTLVAVVGAFVAYLFWGASRATCGLWIGVLLLFAILLFASYDCLRKYNERAAEIVSDNSTVA
jgi:hypothetical protein